MAKPNAHSPPMDHLGRLGTPVMFMHLHQFCDPKCIYRKRHEANCLTASLPYFVVGHLVLEQFGSKPVSHPLNRFCSCYSEGEKHCQLKTTNHYRDRMPRLYHSKVCRRYLARIPNASLANRRRAHMVVRDANAAKLRYARISIVRVNLC